MGFLRLSKHARPCGPVWPRASGREGGRNRRSRHSPGAGRLRLRTGPAGGTPTAGGGGDWGRYVSWLRPATTMPLPAFCAGYLASLCDAALVELASRTVNQRADGGEILAFGRSAARAEGPHEGPRAAQRAEPTRPPLRQRYTHAFLQTAAGKTGRVRTLEYVAETFAASVIAHLFPHLGAARLVRVASRPISPPMGVSLISSAHLHVRTMGRMAYVQMSRRNQGKAPTRNIRPSFPVTRARATSSTCGPSPRCTWGEPLHKCNGGQLEFVWWSSTARNKLTRFGGRAPHVRRTPV